MPFVNEKCSYCDYPEASSLVLGVPMCCSEARFEYLRACNMISQDGDQYCVLLGYNLQEGIAGFGDTEEAAIEAFSEALYEHEKQPSK